MKLNGFTFLLILLLTTCDVSNKDLTEIGSARFEDMVQRHDIAKLTLFKDTEYIEITLTLEALQNRAYNQELESSLSGLSDKGPHYKYKISSIDKFYNQYEELSKNIPREQRIDIDLQVKDQSNFMNLLFNWALILIPVLILMSSISIRQYHIRKGNLQVAGQSKDFNSATENESANRYRYPTLRTIASIYMIAAWIVGIVAVIIAYYYQIGWIALLSLVLGGLVSLGLVALSESIKVFLDIEYNTRKKAEKN